MLRKKKQKELKVPIPKDKKEIVNEVSKLNKDRRNTPEKSKVHKPKKDTKTKIKNAYFPERTFLINMELNNGDHTQFFISTKEDHFKYLDNLYVLDESMKYYVISAKSYAFDYKQNFCLPLKRDWDIKQLNEAISSSGIIECGASTNPTTLDQFVKSKIAEGIMKAQEIDAFFKSVKFIVIVTMIVSIVTLLLLLQSSGALKNIGI